MSGAITALAVGIVVPLILLILLVEEPETEILLGFFVWGSVSGIIAWVANGAGSDLTGVPPGTVGIQYAPVIEEFVKALPLFGLLALGPAFLRRKKTILAAAFAGVGFSVVENYLYMLDQVGQDPLELIRIVLLRSLSTSIMHGLATGIVGVAFFYVARGAFEEFRPLAVFPLVAYSFAVILHALFNLYVLFGRLGRAAAVAAALLLYAVAWYLVTVYYPGLEDRDPVP